MSGQRPPFPPFTREACESSALSPPGQTERKAVSARGSEQDPGCSDPWSPPLDPAPQRRPGRRRDMLDRTPSLRDVGAE
jgi:hypothetical protein